MIAFTDLVVLILGENGMGREHIAHYLHDKSRRSVKSFVAVNCGWLAWHCPPIRVYQRNAHGGGLHYKRISFKRQMAVHCFWTKWATSLWKPNRCYSVPYRRSDTIPLATDRLQFRCPRPHHSCYQ